MTVEAAQIFFLDLWLRTNRTRLKAQVDVEKRKGGGCAPPRGSFDFFREGEFSGEGSQ